MGPYQILCPKIQNHRGKCVLDSLLRHINFDTPEAHFDRLHLLSDVRLNNLEIRTGLIKPKQSATFFTINITYSVYISIQKWNVLGIWKKLECYNSFPVIVKIKFSKKHESYLVYRGNQIFKAFLTSTKKAN
jgi:hypothetical protein